MFNTFYATPLTDLFYNLFRSVEEQPPVISGYPRLSREDYFQMFFPEELCALYLSKTKSNLTWFFNNDSKNKAIKRTLIRMLNQGTQPILNATHQKCQNILWPQAQHAAFDRKALWAVLAGVKIQGEDYRKLSITENSVSSDSVSKLRSFFEADPSAALARLILTLAVVPDAPDSMLEEIWATSRPVSVPQDADGLIRHGNLLYLNDQHEQAFRIYEKVAQLLSRPAQTPEESAMYCRMGIMLGTGDGHYRDEKKARHYLELGCLEENPESYYLLAKYTDGPQADSALAQAAALNHTPALRELGNACFYGQGRKKDLEKARQCFLQGMTDISEAGAYCAYMFGRICEERKDIPAALHSYRIAMEHGYSEAYERLMDLGWLPRTGAEASQMQDAPLRYCVTNGLTGSNRTFVASLTGPLQVTVAGECTASALGNQVTLLPQPQMDAAQSAAQLAQALFTDDREVFPRLDIALLSQDQQDNLNQAIAVLGALEQAALRLGRRKEEMVDCVTIYVEAEHTYASLMLDAAYAAARCAAFSLRLCDPNRDSADQLFYNAPLFLPCLRNPETEQLHLVILGTSPAAMAVLQRAVSLPLTEKHSVTISVLGEDAEVMAQQFDALCPGIASAPPSVLRSVPVFHQCSLKTGQAAALLRQLKANRLAQNEDPGCEAAEILSRGNYFVIAAGEDSLNIRLGTQLRVELLKLDPTFRKLPFIAVHVHNAAAARLAGNIAADAKDKVYSWHSQYDLFCFGSEEQYSWQNLNSDPIELLAEKIHLLYAGDAPSRRTALGSYYRRQYNRDSSRALAIYLSYHCFAAGIALPDWKMYAIAEQIAQMGSAYGQYLKEPDRLEAAARMEHTRWNCFMLSSGWEQATSSQVATYVQRGNPTHQLYLGKLHPFLCAWEDLASREILKDVEEAVHSLLPEKKIYDPRIADRETVLSIPRLLDPAK